jgi:hypothetical protein
MVRPMYGRITSGPMTTVICVRIVVLQVEPDVWCSRCGLACATTITYVTEDGDRPPQAVHRLTYCEAREDR